MEMSLKQLILMLLTVTATAMMIPGQTAICLDNQQKTEEVPSGSNLILNCCLNTEHNERYRITWYFNHHGPSVTNSTRLTTKINNKYQNSSMDEDNRTHTLSNVNRNHSGWYFCKVTVEIPSLRENCSNGTEVIVYPPALSDNWWIWVVLGASSFILFILTVTCVLHSRRQESREEPIYANTPNKQPSPRPSMSAAAVSLKAASSFQDLRAPSPASRYDEGKRRYKH
ncbi:uncharacterized protein LOC116327940 isoform X4 [Oreochromis aureus]|uniref:uncharacterized protein LOC116327940 isoform X4 n=1 Tax=Oreochromis aureus TaxID=47969 RepID=UPI0012BCCE8A|nr:uncharacterized protein LOC116327940 isoform X4 [Oreochromis aureus]